MPLSQFVAKPVTIQAVQLTKQNRDELLDLLGKSNVVDKPWDPINIHIQNPHGVVTLEIGHWLIKDAQGSWYPCNNEIFQQKYQKKPV